MVTNQVLKETEHLGHFVELYLSTDLVNSNNAALASNQILQIDTSPHYGSNTHTIIHDGLKFYVDDVPFICFANGSITNSLLETGATSHIEFVQVVKIKYIYGNEVFEVPFSKEDIFVSTQLSLLEKRRIMKLFTQNHDNVTASTSFHEYLTVNCGFSDKLALMIIFSICFSDSIDISTKDALEKCTRFTSSIGRYGPSPLLYPAYGSNEISQAFCRMSAVKGAVQVLNIKDLNIEQDSVSFFFKEKQYKASYITNKTSQNKSVMYSSYSIEKRIGENDDQTILNVHNIENKPVYELVLTHSSFCTPSNYTLKIFWSSLKEPLELFIKSRNLSTEIKQTTNQNLLI